MLIPHLREKHLDFGLPYRRRNDQRFFSRRCGINMTRAEQREQIHRRRAAPIQPTADDTRKRDREICCAATLLTYHL